MNMTQESILVVDDDKDIVRLVVEYLRKAGYPVNSAYDGESALHVLRNEKPKLVVLDLMLPKKDGWEIIRTLRSDTQLASTLIIALTARVEDSDKILGLELGADDYLTKPFNPRELLARVRSLLRRGDLKQENPSAATYRLAGLKLDTGSRSFSLDDQAIELTPTEFALMRVLIEYPGYVFTRDELVEKGLGYSFAGLGRTLDSHIKNLRRKVEPDPKQPTYIQTVYGVGYRLQSPLA
jgi:two-component system alkaline phosphatase synthesis response regulator PhoP